MKKPYEITHCEYCDSVITVQSPPSKKEYESAQICILNGSILLPKNVVKKNHITGISDSHAFSLDGIYCNYKCLVNHIKKLLYKEGKKTRLPK